MRVKRIVLLLLAILLSAGTAAASYASPSASSLLPNDPLKIWIIADTGQSNALVLTAYNDTSGFSGPVKSADVNFTLDNASLGTISPTHGTTDSNGKLLCTFTVNATRPMSGTARITADITSFDDLTGSAYHTILAWDQKIDHNVPYSASFSYPSETAVESIVPFRITIVDRWSNPIDSRYELENSLPLHNATLHINGPSPPNDCGFTEYGLTHNQKVNLNSNGKIIINITPATKPGWHYLLLDATGSLPEQMKMFKSVANGLPFSMSQSFSPDGTPYATVLADGSSQFSFYYTLFDRYGNPTRNQSIWINTSVPGEESSRISEENGQIWSTYGPKSFTGLYTINATTPANASIKLSKVVRFYNTSPINIEVEANPQVMPSRDAYPTMYSNVSAKITDVLGNGVPDEVVSFTIHGRTFTPAGANETINASFVKSSVYKSAPTLTTSATTDENGYATVKVYPARYATVSEVGYQQLVTGSALVTASWKGNQSDVNLTWKNYPYLSAEVSAEPQQVRVGENVTVSIKLNGDGWALIPRPVDAVLVTDLSTSMNSNNKLTQTKVALKKFVALSGNKMYLSLVSYSNNPTESSTAFTQLYKIQTSNSSAKPFNPYGSVTDRASYSSSYYSDAHIDKDLTLTDSAGLNTTITNYNGNGYTAVACGLHAALKELNTKGHSGYNQSIVLMTDGWANYAPVNATFPLSAYRPSDYSSSPSSAGGSSATAETAAITIASTIKAQNIKIYTVAFGSDADTAALSAIASPGCAFTADTTNIADVYTQIYGMVMTDAGVDTEMSLDLGNLVINNTPKHYGHYFDYVYNSSAPGSTRLDKYNKTPSGAINQHLIPGSDVSTGLPFSSVGPIVINQTDYWKAHSQQLAFSIGNIKVNETWETRFVLTVLQEGNIIIYSPDSQVCFTNGAAGDTCMKLPNLTVTALMNPYNVGVSETTLDVIDLTRTTEGPVTGTIPVTWNTLYNGEKTITEEVSYIHDDDPPVKFETKTLSLADLLTPQTAVLSMDKLPPGGYKIQVHAYTSEADVTKECGPYSFTTQGRPFIKLE